MADATVSLESILRIAEIVSILGGGTLVAFKLGRVTQRMEGSMKLHGDQIMALQGEVKEMGKLMTAVALQGQRLDTMGARLVLLDQRYEELRHGEGYVFPIDAKFGGRKD